MVYNNSLTKLLISYFSITFIYSKCSSKEKSQKDKKCSGVNKNNDTGQNGEKKKNEEEHGEDDNRKPEENDEEDKEEINKIKENLNNTINPLKILLENNKDNVDNFNELNTEISNIKNKINVINSKNEGNSINSEINSFKNKFLNSINNKLSKINTDLINEITKYNDKNICNIGFENINTPSFSITELSENNISAEYNKIANFNQNFNAKKDKFIDNLIQKLRDKVNTENKLLGEDNQISLSEEKLSKIDDIDKFVKLNDEIELNIAAAKGGLNQLFSDKLTKLMSLKEDSYLADEKGDIEIKITNFKLNKDNPSQDDVKSINEYIEGLNKIIEKKKSDKRTNDNILFTRLKNVSTALELSEEEKKPYFKDELISEKELTEFKDLLSDKLTVFKDNKNKLVEIYIKKIKCLNNENNINQNVYTLNNVNIDKVTADEINGFKDKILGLLNNLKEKINSINVQIDKNNIIYVILKSIDLHQTEIEENKKVKEISTEKDDLDKEEEYSTTISNLNELKNSINENVNIINKILILLNKDIKIEYNNDELTISSEVLTTQNVEEKINFKNEKTLDDLINEKNKEIKDFCEILLNKVVNDEVNIKNDDKYEVILGKLKIFNIDEIKNVVNTNVCNVFHIKRSAEIESEKGKKKYNYIYFEFIKNKKFKIYCYVERTTFGQDNIYFVFNNSYFYIHNRIDDYINNILKQTGFGFVKIKMKLLNKVANFNEKGLNDYFDINNKDSLDKYGKSEKESFYLNLEDGYIYHISLDKNDKITTKEEKIKYGNIKDYVSFEGRTNELKI